jgi:hypothetical protein
MARIPGSSGERLYSLLAAYMRQTPAGAAIFADLENMPHDQGARHVAAAKLVGLINQDRRFAAELVRAVGNVQGSATYNTIGGNVTGTSVQADNIYDSTIARDIDQSHTDNRRTRINFGGLVLILALVLGLGATVIIAVTNLVDGDTTSGSASAGQDAGVVPGGDPGGGVTPPNQGQPAPDNDNPPLDDGDVPPENADCGRAGRPELTLSPTQGSVETEITVSGTGFIPNGIVEIVFHADHMGEVQTDCHGAFTATLAIPQKDFYRNFPNQSFDVHTTELTSGGQYQGNGDFNGAQFHVTG